MTCSSTHPLDPAWLYLAITVFTTVATFKSFWCAMEKSVIFSFSLHRDGNREGFWRVPGKNFVPLEPLYFFTEDSYNLKFWYLTHLRGNFTKLNDSAVTIIAYIFFVLWVQYLRSQNYSIGLKLNMFLLLVNLSIIYIVLYCGQYIPKCIFSQSLRG